MKCVSNTHTYVYQWSITWWEYNMNEIRKGTSFWWCATASQCWDKPSIIMTVSKSTPAMWNCTRKRQVKKFLPYSVPNLGSSDDNEIMIHCHNHYYCWSCYFSLYILKVQKISWQLVAFSIALNDDAAKS